MKLWLLTVKALIRGRQYFYSWYLNLFYQLFRHVFFSHLGKRNMFWGKINFSSIGNDNITAGDGCIWGERVLLSASPGAKISIGNHTSFNSGCLVVSVFEIEIGDNVSFGEYVSIRDQNHQFKIYHDQDVAYTGAKIKIEDHVWVGRGCVILPGVTIGRYSVIGANSVVSRSIPPYSVAVGAPAKVIRTLDDGVKK